MADAVPVSDVLCEAMEYLVKLGSNLRVRSENLKEKRIRRDKLRNAHAVQKAASKVLLICELSKKSIENVETGVKKVLEQISLGQGQTASDGGNSSNNSPNAEKVVNYEYIEYESHRLRLRKKVDMNHFTSVKVHARCMSTSMQDNYPVFLDCKLLRLRNKETELEEDGLAELVDDFHEETNSNSSNNSHTCTQNICEQTTTNSTLCENEPVACAVEHQIESTNVEKSSGSDHSNSDNKTSEHGRRNLKENVGTMYKNDNEQGDSNDLSETGKRTELNTVDDQINGIIPCGNVQSMEEAIQNSITTENYKKNKKDTDKQKNEVQENLEDKLNEQSTSKKQEQGNNEEIVTNVEDQLSEKNAQNKQERKIRSKPILGFKKSKPRNKRETSKKYRHIQIMDDSSESDNQNNESSIAVEERENSLERPKRFDCNTTSSEDSVRNISPNPSFNKNTEPHDTLEIEDSLIVNNTSDNKNIDECMQDKNIENMWKSNDDVDGATKNVNNTNTDHVNPVKKNKKNKRKVTFSDEKDLSDCSSIEILESKCKKKRQSDDINEISKSECDKTDDSNHQNNKGIDKENVNTHSITTAVEENLRDGDVINNEDYSNNIEEEQEAKASLQNDNGEVLSTESRSFLRCVSLDKLMKPDITSSKTNDSKSVKDKNDRDKKTKVSPKKSENINHIPPFKHDMSLKTYPNKKKMKLDETLSSQDESSKENDEEFWIQKRKEVKKFVSKQFMINVNRLPELSQRFLCTHNLKKITHYGSVICEAFQNIIDSGNSNEGCTLIDVSSAKNALLDDSDSDKSKKLKATTRKLKNALNESDSEKDCNSTPEAINEKKNSECRVANEDYTCENTTRNSTTPEPTNKSHKNDEVKSSLLHDSTDDDNNKTPKKKSTKEVNTPPSKRKHIMESMYAKKMLLTYSSSSDTEDEQLRNVVKEIRVSLLNGKSTDEDGNNDINTTKSDSECNSIKSRNRNKHDSNKATQSENDHRSKRKISFSENDSSAKNAVSQVGESSEDLSNSSLKKMGPNKTKVSASSSQNSDTQDSHDKDIDGLTNLNTLIKKHRRRDSTSTDRTRSSTRTVRKMPKVPQISEEGFLKAEDSSEEEASLADSDVGEEVELPAVSVTGLNGDSISHLAKDDLLEESDSSSSHVKSSRDVKEEADTDDEAVKSRRRKGHATISSDSEAGGSRKKDATVKYSDFEDSEDESSETGKRMKRKKKGSDSDASGGSSTNEGKKKRRRIKNIDDSDGSGSETENEGRNKHGRKNIRKVMSKNQLEEATKKAARQEKERIARIADRQKLYNNLEFDESGKPDEVVLDKVILDFDPETKEPLIEVDKGLVKKLKPHQANGIKFMWDACFESVKRIKKDKGSGCILAHCMGLGKTLQVVSLTHTLLIHSDLTRVNRVLVVCPLSTVLNWVNEFKIWLKHAVTEYEVDIYELSRYKQNSERAWQLQQWFSGGGVCVLGYEMFRNLSADNGKKFKKKMLKSFQESLVDPGPDLVVCDEGHLLKNEKTSLSQAMNRVRTLRRIVLTGTPLQNNLKEYYCMVQFVKPNLLGKYNEYLNRFVNPITNGQYTDSTEHDIRIMKRRSHVLHKMLDGAVQRRDYGVLAPFLPPKHEYVLFITLTEVQIKLYQHYLDNYSRRPLAGKSSGFLFPDFQSLQRIWTHPLVLKYNSERYEIMQQKKREREEEEDSEGSLADFIDDDSTPEESTTEESSDSLSDGSDDSRKKTKKKKATKKGKNKASTRRGTRANPVEADDDVVAIDDDVQAKVENPTEWWMSLVSEDELDDLRHSHKLVLLFDILRQCEAIGDKLLVFSQSLYSLDLIEHFLGKVDEATQDGRVDEKLNGHVGSWSPGVDYFRLDGSTSCENRSIWCKNFNREDNPRARLFLISTRAGGLGINLVAANRVIIFDVSWNPSHDVQSIFRVYRFGQKKPCYVYRFLAMGTMEEKIYERQVTKQAISKRVIDEQQIDRHYAENDLAELYKFEPTPPTPRELPSLPKDRLFAEMLKEYEDQIYKYHEHDSLLENKEEETLTEEERKAAWEDFENEKTRPPPVPFNAYNMHNGMVPGLLAQQQQQLAYAALAAMLRKDVPNISDDQIRGMLPIIYQSNPAMFGGYDYGLLQKMSEIYKYAQPGMMNPGMMNPVMNPGGGAAGGMSLGGSSGLQYEPPWQRQQQQQQQQMQFQRLMQQQNMGAKYYAGGLGSRDPVAMALQQQRAREMMLGERGRPRGRPPGTTAQRPRAPPTGDVVNLDSD